jgi:hypothetical protein
MWRTKNFVEAEAAARTSDMVSFSCLTWKPNQDLVEGWNFSTFKLMDVLL